MKMIDVNKQERDRLLNLDKEELVDMIQVLIDERHTVDGITSEIKKLKQKLTARDKKIQQLTDKQNTHDTIVKLKRQIRDLRNKR